MKNILNQLGATAANINGATPTDQSALGMNPMGPAVQPAPGAMPMPVPANEAVQPDPLTQATDPNFSPNTQNAANYVYGNTASRGY